MSQHKATSRIILFTGLIDSLRCGRSMDERDFEEAYEYLKTIREFVEGVEE